MTCTKTVDMFEVVGDSMRTILCMLHEKTYIEFQLKFLELKSDIKERVHYSIKCHKANYYSYYTFGGIFHG
jgi:hypothetical protein